MRAGKTSKKHPTTLKNRADFLKIAREGVKWTAQGLIIQAMPNDLGVIRVGYTVSKKTDPSAVKRNRIKRRLRAAVADTLALCARESCDFVLIGRKAGLDRPYEALCGDLKWCLGKMGYLKEK